MIDLNDGTHSRFDEEHCDICEECRADRYDAMLEMAMDAHLDAMSEMEEYNNEGDDDE